jgi:hypothetical protein
MACADRAICPRCGAPFADDEPAGLCPHCRLSDTKDDKSEIAPVTPPSPRWAHRKLTLASAVAAIAAILLGGLWFGNSKGNRVRRSPSSARPATTPNAAPSSPGSSSVHWPTPTVRLTLATTGGAGHP